MRLVPVLLGATSPKSIPHPHQTDQQALVYNRDDGEQGHEHEHHVRLVPVEEPVDVVLPGRRAAGEVEDAGEGEVDDGVDQEVEEVAEVDRSPVCQNFNYDVDGVAAVDDEVAP